MHVPVWTVKLMENMLELALLPSCLLVFLLPPPVLTPRSCLAPALPEMFDAFQAKMVMVKLEKLLETFYQLEHRDLPVMLLCRARLKPRPKFLGQILKLFVFPWESREGL